MKLIEAKHILRKNGYRLIKEAAEGGEVIKITFDGDTDGLVANDCFQGIMGDHDLEPTEDGWFTDGTVSIQQEHDYILIRSERGYSNVASFVADSIARDYKKYQPKIDILESKTSKRKIMKEAATERHYGLSFEEAQELFDNGVSVAVDGTGAFGGNKRTEVYSFNVEDAYGEDECDPEEYWYDDGCVVLTNDIGQSGANWTEWDAIADQAWVNEEDYQKVFG